MTCEASSSATSLPGSADGHLQLDLLDGPTTDRSGQDHAHASLSASRGKGEAPTTSDTSGPSSAISSRSAVLQASLASRLRARLEGRGSPEYVLTWKSWDMASGPQICARRASVRRTSGSGFSGWPTPTVGNASGSQQALARKERAKEKGSTLGVSVTALAHQAQMAGWVTPSARDWKTRRA